MADHMTPEQRSRAMKQVKLKNGSLELILQRQLLDIGLRFELHDSTLPGSPDIVFPEERVVVFVDGDFWHGWRLPAWESKLSGFWREKLRANRVRDRRNFRRLRARGWTVVRVWQHELTTRSDARYLVKIRRALRRGLSARAGAPRNRSSGGASRPPRTGAS